MLEWGTKQIGHNRTDVKIYKDGMLTRSMSYVFCYLYTASCKNMDDSFYYNYMSHTRYDIKLESS